MLPDRKPLYIVLAEKIARAIEEGAYPVGGFLPTETQLCDEYKVSRTTVREAVRVLQDLGVVSRKQGSGTVVESTKARGKYVFEIDAIPDLWQYVESTELKVGNTRLIDHSDALVTLPAGEWYLIEAVRFLDGEPLAWKHVYLDARYGEAVQDVGTRRVPIYSLLEQRYGLKTERIHQSIGAVTMPAPAVAALGMADGAIGLEILRTYYDDSHRLFEATLTIYPPNRFKYDNELKLQYGSVGA
ncbi:MAG: GntR family transcriptional regulator [Pigmentiphaga sp.]|uniref:GntR family transcriptional regulator n=1 Tax=Pigmentiphaga sp. TaxID=1977564 RepID=UPI0029BEC53A|nr:GntR family transcriptional regulator [Pigmentiphaga sp.]MDX3905880.1 GntR family transcriptional regulator [Pigmentiphaga sp.]